MKQPIHKTGLWNPYVAGVMLGLVLMAAFYVMGIGLGASGLTSRASAVIAHTVALNAIETNGYLKRYYQSGDRYPLINWIVFQMIGVFIGGLIGSLTCKRFNTTVARGPRPGW